MPILPFWAMCFMVRKGFIYTIAVYFYAYRPAFSTILHCILLHFTLRLAPKRTAFCRILHAILQQIAPYSAKNGPKYGANGGFFK